MSISSNYTSTGYVPTSTSNVSCASGASGSSGASGITSTAGVTGTSGVSTRSSSTYTAQAPQTQMTATGPTSSNVTSTPQENTISQLPDGTYQKVTNGIKYWAYSAAGPWYPCTDKTLSDVAPNIAGLVASGNVTGSDNVALNNEKNEKIGQETFSTTTIGSIALGMFSAFTGKYSTATTLISAGIAGKDVTVELWNNWDVLTGKKKNATPAEQEKAAWGAFNILVTLGCLNPTGWASGFMYESMKAMDNLLLEQYIDKYGEKEGKKKHQEYHQSLHDVTTGNSAGPSMFGSQFGFMM